MKRFFLIMMFMSAALTAQNYQFLYDYSFAKDSLNKSEVESEIMSLMVRPEKKQSLFAGLKKIKSDSTMVADASKGVYSFPDPTLKVREVVEKNQGKTFFYTANHTPEKVYKVEDSRPMNWKITEEKKKVGEFMAQKANVAFGGRIWEAWFTTEIPISEGPYKFNGLPGLIIEMSDESKAHVYKLISVSKKSDFYDFMKNYDYQNTVKLNVEKYNKMQIEYRKNPMASFMQKITAGEMIFRSEEDKRETIKKTKEYLENKVRKENNPIEKL